MQKITCSYFCTATGRSPAKEFMDSLDQASQAKFFFAKELLEAFGPRLPMPHARYLGDHMYELRFHGSRGAIRMLYFFWRGQAILTNGFIKKSPKTPANEKAAAVNRRRLFLTRQGRP